MKSYRIDLTKGVLSTAVVGEAAGFNADCYDLCVDGVPHDPLVRSILTHVRNDYLAFAGIAYGIARSFATFVANRVHPRDIEDVDVVGLPVTITPNMWSELTTRWPHTSGEIRSITYGDAEGTAVPKEFSRHAGLYLYVWNGGYQPAWGSRSDVWSLIPAVDDWLHACYHESNQLHDDLKVLYRSCCSQMRALFVPCGRQPITFHDWQFIAALTDLMLNGIRDYPDDLRGWLADKSFTDTLVSDAVSTLSIALYDYVRQVYSDDLAKIGTWWDYTSEKYVLIHNMIVEAITEEFLR